MIIHFFKLLCGHAFADFAFQNDFIANNKNRHAIPKGYDSKLHGPKQIVWLYVLSSHALIHGTMAAIAMNNVYVGMAEAASHWVIDFGKCEKWYGIHLDQWLHIGSKVAWILIFKAG